MNNTELQTQLAFIAGNFKPITDAITSLQVRQSMVQSVEKVIENLSAVLLVEPYNAKLHNVIQNNPDYAKMKELKSVLDGKDVSTQSGISPLLAPLYKFAPMSSADIARVFSSMGDVISPKRRSLTVEHLEFYVILYWNTFGKKYIFF